MDSGRTIEHLLRELAPRVLASLVRRFGDFCAAEDAVQEALLAASLQWSRDGLPEQPYAWLMRVAARRLTDQVRSEASRRRREELAVALVPPEEQIALAPDEALERGRDDGLALVFMCCHPALSTASAIALTLRAVGGLTTAEIAKAYLVPEATMAQRISRAKRTIATSGIGFELPAGEAWAARMHTVLHVLYLIFNEGYTASFGASLHRDDLSAEAIRLTRMVHRLAPDDPEVTGLLALMLLTDARRVARTGPAGELIPLDEQERSLWDRASIGEGTALVEKALASGAVGPYQIQAAIAALHDEAESTDRTDWPQILALYGLLRRMDDGPMVALNEAIAVAMLHGPAAGLERLDALAEDRRLATSHRLYAVRAHLLERAGDRDGAEILYRRAAEQATNVPERNYLLLRSARVAADRS